MGNGDLGGVAVVPAPASLTMAMSGRLLGTDLLALSSHGGHHLFINRIPPRLPKEDVEKIILAQLRHTLQVSKCSVIPQNSLKNKGYGFITLDGSPSPSDLDAIANSLNNKLQVGCRTLGVRVCTDCHNALLGDEDAPVFSPSPISSPPNEPGGCEASEIHVRAIIDARPLTAADPRPAAEAAGNEASVSTSLAGGGCDNGLVSQQSVTLLQSAAVELAKQSGAGGAASRRRRGAKQQPQLPQRDPLAAEAATRSHLHTANHHRKADHNQHRYDYPDKVGGPKGKQQSIAAPGSQVLPCTPLVESHPIVLQAEFCRDDDARPVAGGRPPAALRPVAARPTQRPHTQPPPPPPPIQIELNSDTLFGANTSGAACSPRSVSSAGSTSAGSTSGGSTSGGSVSGGSGAGGRSGGANLAAAAIARPPSSSGSTSWGPGDARSGDELSPPSSCLALCPDSHHHDSEQDLPPCPPEPEDLPVALSEPGPVPAADQRASSYKDGVFRGQQQQQQEFTRRVSHCQRQHEPARAGAMFVGQENVGDDASEGSPATSCTTSASLSSSRPSTGPDPDAGDAAPRPHSPPAPSRLSAHAAKTVYVTVPVRSVRSVSAAHGAPNATPSAAASPGGAGGPQRRGGRGVQTGSFAVTFKPAQPLSAAAGFATQQQQQQAPRMASGPYPQQSRSRAPGGHRPFSQQQQQQQGGRAERTGDVVNTPAGSSYTAPSSTRQPYTANQPRQQQQQHHHHQQHTPTSRPQQLQLQLAVAHQQGNCGKATGNEAASSSSPRAAFSRSVQLTEALEDPEQPHWRGAVAGAQNVNSWARVGAAGPEGSHAGHLGAPSSAPRSASSQQGVQLSQRPVGPQPAAAHQLREQARARRRVQVPSVQQQQQHQQRQVARSSPAVTSSFMQHAALLQMGSYQAAQNQQEQHPQQQQGNALDQQRQQQHYFVLSPQQQQQLARGSLQPQQQHQQQAIHQGHLGLHHLSGSPVEGVMSGRTTTAAAGAGAAALSSHLLQAPAGLLGLQQHQQAPALGSSLSTSPQANPALLQLQLLLGGGRPDASDLRIGSPLAPIASAPPGLGTAESGGSGAGGWRCGSLDLDFAVAHIRNGVGPAVPGPALEPLLSLGQRASSDPQPQPQPQPQPHLQGPPRQSHPTQHFPIHAGQGHHPMPVGMAGAAATGHQPQTARSDELRLGRGSADGLMLLDEDDGDRDSADLNPLDLEPMIMQLLENEDDDGPTGRLQHRSPPPPQHHQPFSVLGSASAGLAGSVFCGGRSAPAATAGMHPHQHPNHHHHHHLGGPQAGQQPHQPHQRQPGFCVPGTVDANVPVQGSSSAATAALAAVVGGPRGPPQPVPGAGLGTTGGWMATAAASAGREVPGGNGGAAGELPSGLRLASASQPGLHARESPRIGTGLEVLQGLALGAPAPRPLSACVTPLSTALPAGKSTEVSTGGGGSGGAGHAGGRGGNFRGYRGTGSVSSSNSSGGGGGGSGGRGSFGVGSRAGGGRGAFRSSVDARRPGGGTRAGSSGPGNARLQVGARGRGAGGGGGGAMGAGVSFDQPATVAGAVPEAGLLTVMEGVRA